MPESLLDFSHVEVSALENITILGEGKDQHIGLHVFPGQKKKNGGIRAEISIKPAAVLDGPNMHNDYQHYLKLGMYRHPDIATANSIFIDDISITPKSVP